MTIVGGHEALQLSFYFPSFFCISMIEPTYGDEPYVAGRNWSKIFMKLGILVLLALITLFIIVKQYQSVKDVVDGEGCKLRTERKPVGTYDGIITSEQHAQKIAQEYFSTPVTPSNVNATEICEQPYVFKSEDLSGAVICQDGKIIKIQISCPLDAIDTLKKSGDLLR